MNIHQGRGDNENTHKCVGTGMVITFVASIVLLAVFYPLRTQILTLFGASVNSIGHAVEYLYHSRLFSYLYAYEYDKRRSSCRR